MIFCLTGPESTGKTTLAADLAAYFGGIWVAEKAREYVEKLGRPYTFDDVCKIAEYQIVEQKNLPRNGEKTFFLDTDLIITKVWLQHCYGKTPDFVDNSLKNSPVDCYLLTYPDIVWQAEQVREHGSDAERMYFFEWYRREIEKLGKPYFVVKGQGAKRLQNAINEVKKFENGTSK